MEGGNIFLYYTGIMKAKAPSYRLLYCIGWVRKQKFGVHIQKIRSMVSPEKKWMKAEATGPYDRIVEGLKDEYKIYSGWASRVGGREWSGRMLAG
jgi:hypothetical protein